MRVGAQALITVLFVALAAGPALATVDGAQRVGAITWHAKKYVSHQLTLRGYVLKRYPGYVLLSDEPTGKVSAHDLPVTGPGTDGMVLGGQYIVHGVFLKGGLKAANGNIYHFALSAPPTPR